MPKSLTDLLVIYFYKNNYLSLPQLGHFEVVQGEDLSQPEQIDFTRIPQQIINFKFNSKEETDTELIKYITAHTRKMQSLALADLFTFTEQAVQMLNVMQPVSFSGIGTIQKDAKGKVNFSPGIYRPELLKDAEDLPSEPQFKEAASSGSGNSFSGTTTTMNSSESNSTRSMAGMLIIIVCVVIAAALIYFIFSNKASEGISEFVNTSKTEKEKKDTSSVSTKTATVTPPNSENQRKSPPENQGRIHYQIISEQDVDSGRAFHRYRQLSGWGHPVKITTTDSVHYDIAIPITSMVADTARMKDSIRRLYGHEAIIRYESGE